MKTWPTKDPNEVIDYKVNWADPTDPRLEDGETLTLSEFSIVSGDVVIDSDDFEATGLATVWLSAGAAGTTAVVLNRVETSGGRTYDQSVKLRIRSH